MFISFILGGNYWEDFGKRTKITQSQRKNCRNLDFGDYDEGLKAAGTLFYFASLIFASLCKLLSYPLPYLLDRKHDCQEPRFSNFNGKIASFSYHPCISKKDSD